MARIAPQFPAAFARLHPDPWTLPFWEASREHRLMVQTCARCTTPRMPPAPFCWKCQSQECEWVEHPGEGVVYSFTITRQAALSDLAGAVPFVAAVVDLDGLEDVRLVGNVVDFEPEAIRIGLPVKVAWDDIDAHLTVPRFTVVTEIRS
jgi:uncharacterized OB-fold protein